MTLFLQTRNIARAVRPLQQRTRLPVQHQTIRSFTLSPRLGLKEDKERSPEEANALKEEQRKKAEKGKGEWHEGLASQSESHVAAERENVNDHDQHMKELQQEGAKEAEKEKEGK